jgi:hypothetical protein
VKPAAFRPARENAIQRAIERELGAEPDALLLRNNVGVARNVDDDGHERFTRYGLGPGSPDLILILAPRGRILGLEIKRSGESPTPEQRAVHDVWRKYGAIVATVRSPEQALAVLEHAREEEDMTTAYEVLGQHFPTRHALATYCGAMVSHGALSADDEAFVRELLTGHMRAKEITGRGILRIVVGENGFGDPSFIVERKDGRRIPFSYLSCITTKFAINAPPEAA